jgi:shikimate dehydrogenase
MVNAAFRHMDLDAQYVSFPVRPLDVVTAVKGLQALGVNGVNVTIPHKQTVFDVMTHVTDVAKLAKAVNTIRFDIVTGDIIGHNTDVDGWWLSVCNHLSNARPIVALLGAGGAARAITTALSVHAPGSRIQVVARTEQHVQPFLEDFAKGIIVSGHDWDHRHEVIDQSTLVINTTPIGMWPSVSDSPVTQDDCFHTGQVVQDIVYRPLQTAMMQQALTQGAAVVDGLGMLVHQGAHAIQFWTNRQPPLAVMRHAAEQFLQVEDKGDETGGYTKIPM